MQIKDVHILVVDDVNAMRVQIGDLLKTFGFAKISSAGSGEEAKRMIANTPVQLVLCDWHMAPTDGMEVLKFVRSQAQYKDLGFVMVTAECTREHVLGAIEAGVDDYLVKPLTPVQIQSKIYSALIKKKVLT